MAEAGKKIEWKHIKRNFLISYNQNAISNHPNVLGLTTKIENGRRVPIGHQSNYIGKGDKVVFYIRDNATITGIFEVGDNLSEDDSRRAKDWPTDIQFDINPMYGGIKSTLFKPLIKKLNLFKKLRNPEKDYRMAIGGKNYIRALDGSDWQNVESILKVNTFDEEDDKPENDKMRQTTKKKYGPGGEGKEHKRLKEAVAKCPNSIGLVDVIHTDVEHSFISGDAVDVLFQLKGNRFVVVEIETDNPLPGCYQALKYKVLRCAEMKEDIASTRVEAVLAAKTIPKIVQEFCLRYGIRAVLLKD